uniref:Uncharacterized protein n=1 Tax=Thermogemmatispora argillosa TaxID=2045280 RepID=A0A455T168_9CHLR|nr:hypothetical protein KTA_13080 [Thermogemmatispora argillosa]
MSAEIELLQSQEAGYFVSSSLLGTGQPTPEARQAEAVRVVLWALCRGRAGALSMSRDTAVSTRTLLHQARRLLLPFAPQRLASASFDQDRLREAGAGFGALPAPEQIDRRLLERLAEQGDLLQLIDRGAHWLPAPPRLVPLGSHYLLAGGLPLHALPAVLQEQITLRNTLRLLPLSAGASWPYAYQSLTNWLGPQPSSLPELQSFFQQAPLISVDSAPLEDEPSEVYWPHHAGPQEERWLPVTRAARLPAGRYLLRRPDRWSRGRFHYRIVLLDQGRILQESHPWEEMDIETPRLCYALDQAAGRKTVAHFAPTGSETLALGLESRLPRREYRLLQAVGERQPTSQRATLRYRWCAIARADLPLVTQALQALGITSEYHSAASRD